MTTHELLAAARKHAGLSQSKLAEKIGRSQAAVSRHENGVYKVGDDYVKSVFEACGLPPDWTPPVESESIAA